MGGAACAITAQNSARSRQRLFKLTWRSQGGRVAGSRWKHEGFVRCQWMWQFVASRTGEGAAMKFNGERIMVRGCGIKLLAMPLNEFGRRYGEPRGVAGFQSFPFRKNSGGGVGLVRELAEVAVENPRQGGKIR